MTAAVIISALLFAAVVMMIMRMCRTKRKVGNDSSRACPPRCSVGKEDKK